MYVIIADAAYEPSERVVPMFYGIHRADEQCDNYNFYASQCRIRIEMAFGLMQMKWGILWRPMRVKLRNVNFVIMAISRLHNYVINEWLRNKEQQEEVGTGLNRHYQPSDLDSEVDEEDASAELIAKYLRGVSIIRNVMVERIVRLGLKRPKSNSLRNKELD